MRVQQLADGTYVRVLTDVESKLLERIKKEEARRLVADHVLKNRDSVLARRLGEADEMVAALANQVSLFSQQLNELAQRVVALQDAVANLRTGADTYTKEEIAGLLAFYRVEEIVFPYQRPTNEYFDRTSQDKIRTGYASFPGARLKEDDRALPASTMRRYTINARVGQATSVPLAINSGGYATVYVNSVQTVSVPELSENYACSLSLQPGWNRLQFLTANRQPGNYFDIGVNLTDYAEAFSCLTCTGGLLDGRLLLPYSVSPDKLGK